MKRHVHWVGIVFLFCAGFLPIYGAEISPEEAVRLLEHEMEHTWVITTQRSGLASITGAVEKNLMNQMMDKRAQKNPAGWLPEAEIAANRKPSILLLFFEKIPKDLQIQLVNYVVEKSQHPVSTGHLEAVITYATEHAPRLVVHPAAPTAPRLAPLLMSSTRAGAIPSAASGGDVVHYNDLPISEIRLPSPEVFSFGLPANFTLYLGTARGYWNINNVMAVNHITHTVSFVDAATEKPNPLPPHYEISQDHQLHIKDFPDTPNAPLLKYLPETTAFISHASQQGTIQHPAHVFVHCHAGKSRSPSVIVAFLLKSRAEYLQQHHRSWKAYTTEEAAYLQTLNPSAGKDSATMTDFVMAMLKTSRSIVEINLGFYNQLKEYEQSLQKQVDEMVRGASPTTPATPQLHDDTL